MERSWRLFVIACVAVAAVAFPVFVRADTGGSGHTETHIVDPSTATNQAKVDVTGALKVLALPGLDPTSYRNHIFESVNGVPAQLSGTFPPSVRLAVTSLTINHYVGGGPFNVQVAAYQAPAGGTCMSAGAAFKGTVALVRILPGSTHHLAYPYPHLAPQGPPAGPWCLRASAFGGGAGQVASIQVNGYVA